MCAVLLVESMATYLVLCCTAQAVESAYLIISLRCGIIATNESALSAEVLLSVKR